MSSKNLAPSSTVEKPFRILRARRNADRRVVNSYLEYFTTEAEAKKAPKIDNRKWECEKIRIEYFHADKGKWLNHPILTA